MARPHHPKIVLLKELTNTKSGHQPSLSKLFHARSNKDVKGDSHWPIALHLPLTRHRIYVNSRLRNQSFPGRNIRLLRRLSFCCIYASAHTLIQRTPIIIDENTSPVLLLVIVPSITADPRRSSPPVLHLRHCRRQRFPRRFLLLLWRTLLTQCEKPQLQTGEE